ncbi:MAG TPA: hypothetical protein GX725_00780 [Mollicutes bacterium]|jgi:hypothetical protein|nr:hypothetical protein [Mollicutes bacterium]
MIILKNEELNNVYGGGFGLWLAIGSLITFLIGVVDGYVRPLKCNK